MTRASERQMAIAAAVREHCARSTCLLDLHTRALLCAMVTIAAAGDEMPVQAKLAETAGIGLRSLTRALGQLEALDPPLVTVHGSPAKYELHWLDLDDWAAPEEPESGPLAPERRNPAGIDAAVVVVAPEGRKGEPVTPERRNEGLNDPPSRERDARRYFSSSSSPFSPAPPLAPECAPPPLVSMPAAIAIAKTARVDFPLAIRADLQRRLDRGDDTEDLEFAAHQTALYCPKDGARPAYFLQVLDNRHAERVADEGKIVPLGSRPSEREDTGT